MATKKSAKSPKKKRVSGASTPQVTVSGPSGVVTGSSAGASPLLDENEAAAYLRISRTTLIRLRNAGEGKIRPQHTRVGNRVFYTKEQLDRYIERCGGSGDQEAVSTAARFR